MKRNKFRLTLSTAALGLLAGLGACKDYLDVEPNAYYTTDQLFSTVSGATTAVIAAYDMLSGDRTYGTRLNLYYPYDTDELIGAPGAANSGNRGISRYKAFPTNAEIINPWNDLYQGVEKSNICIKNIPQMDLYRSGSAADTAALHRLYGEALTLRAQYLYELIRNWGDVPAPLTPTEATASFLLPQVSRNQTLDTLIANLGKAQKLVPWRTNIGAANERITKGAIKALRARLALQRGGYSANATTGQIERPSDYLNYYRIAQQECAELMRHREQHTLNPSFYDLFKSFNELRRESASEVIFEVAMGGASATADSKLGYYDGPRLNASPLYGSSQGTIVAVPTYFYAFDSTDVRRDVTLTPYTIGTNNNQAGTTLVAITTGKFRRDWRVPLQNGAGNYLGYNWPLIRFADVLLMFAEAENELNGPSTAAKNALLEVRTRAYAGNATRAAAGLDLSSKDNFFTALKKERLLEFGGEGIRKYDLLRWGQLATQLAATKAELAKMQAGTAPYNTVPVNQYFRVVNGQVQWARSFYRPAPAATPTGTTAVAWRSTVNAAYITNTKPGGTGLAADFEAGKGKELLPIPQSTLDTDPNVKQNFGYGN
ncbi:RagB/SusD family nutrient uptake outer membrane protein [Hymenobacter persicinus]|uniref:RagB/SusD family nutrient uptake outer membrane protein n=1 Tax=Hymenobacter persicinus TaxID=2025506 RepID=A0A4Q5LBX2_9BACT|nr:RagB/SusD family nutrient uptake outer membrane protein [Hymenobacter persicinus]RYU77235.1 RagB/SusD family nutrient uptake outer membrane protein [Hymenobacter persicinus]